MKGIFYGMKFYFLSSLPCALCINGAYFGKTDTFARHADVCAKDEVFVEFRPENALPISFFITENLPFSPPEKCDVYLLPDGIAIYANDFTPCDFTLQVLAQSHVHGGQATVFRQGGVQVCFEREKDTFIKALPPAFLPKTISAVGDCILLTSEEKLCALDLTGEILLFERYLSYEIDGDVLHAVLPLNDLLRREAKCVWRFSTGIRCEQFTLSQPDTADKTPLVAYAFFESVLLGEDYTQYLCDNLQEKAAQVKEFLGDFLSVLPMGDDCGLVYQKAERLYEIKIFRVQLQDGRISEIQG